MNFEKGGNSICTCVKEIEDGLKEEGDKDVDLVNTGYFFEGENMKWTTTSTVEYIDAEAKSGKDRVKEIPITHTYCPFCGVKYE